MEYGPIPRKVIETIFRQWWVLLTPIILTPLLVLLLTATPAVYRSQATAWVSDSPVPGSRGAGDGGPAAVQAAAIADLLVTRTFREEVATEAGLVTADASTLEKDTAIRLVAERVRVAAAGSNVLVFNATAPAADVAQRIVAAVVDRYQARLAGDAARESAAVVSYFERQVASAQAEVAKSQAELTAYLKAHPLATPGLDGDLLVLQSRADAQGAGLRKAEESLQDARSAGAAGSGLQDVVVTVQDTASLAIAPEPATVVARYGYPAAGVLAGGCIAIAYLWLACRADHSIRSSEDVRAAGVRLLGVVPELRRTRGRAFPGSVLHAPRTRDAAASSTGTLGAAPPSANSEQAAS